MLVFVFHFCLAIWIIISSTSIGGKIDKQIKIAFALLLDMAHKMKRTLTRAEQAKLRKENVERAKGMKEAREKCRKRGVEKEASKEKKKEGVTGKLKRGICALREIRKYQSGTELLIW